MANKRTETFIDELSETQIDALKQCQFGVPVGVINENTLQSLDDRDLIEVIKYTHPRSVIAIPGFVLSEAGNQVVEELAMRAKAETLRTSGEAAAQEEPETEEEEESDNEAD